MKAKVAKRGQVTIPQDLRKKLGIRSGTILDFKVNGHTLVATKTEQEDPVQKVYGCLGKGLNTDQIISELRGNKL